MIFPYSSIISELPSREDYVLLRRPEIPVNITGPAGSVTYLALVDTGSDNTILPKSIADLLAIEVRSDADSTANVFGGHRVQLLVGEAALELESKGQCLRWMTPVSFFDFHSPGEETLILGHAEFLDYFTATFDGQLGLLTLLPNDDLPTEPA